MQKSVDGVQLMAQPVVAHQVAVAVLVHVILDEAVTVGAVVCRTWRSCPGSANPGLLWPSDQASGQLGMRPT